ncbi:MAG: hypothetical protein ACI9R3_000743 [Verrucomicrobiales bacterium]|jgi:hypothetical protein
MKSIKDLESSQLRRLSRLFCFGERGDIRRTVIVLGAPWFFLCVVGTLGIAWALKEFDQWELEEVAVELSEMQLYEAALPQDVSIEIEEATEAGDSVEEIAEVDAVASANGKKTKARQSSLKQAGDKLIRQAIKGRQQAKETTRKKPKAAPVDPAPIVSRLLDRASKLAGQTEAAVDQLLAVAERQSRLAGKPGMDISLLRAANEAGELKSDNARAKALTKITTVQAQLGSLDEARATSRLIDDEGLRDVALAALSRVEAGDDDIAGAKRTAMSIRRPDKMADALSGIAQTQAQKRDPRGARTTASQITNGETRSKTLQRIAMVQAAQSDMEGAQMTVRSITDVRIKARSNADLVARSLLVGDVCCAEFIASAIQVKQEKDRAYETIARYRTQNGDLIGASQMISRINDRQSKSRALTSVAMEEAKSMDFNTARNTVARIPDSGVAERALAGIAKLQAGLSLDARAAKFTARLIKDSETEAAALKDIAGALARKGEMGDAHSTARGIPVLQQRSLAFLEIGKQHFLRGNLPAAQEMRDHARDVAYAIPQQAQQSKQLSAIAVEEAKSGDFRDAVLTAENIEVPRVRDDALAKIAVELASGGEVDGAWSTADSITSETKQQDTILKVAESIGAQAPVEQASMIVQHFSTPEEKISFILSVADRRTGRR